MNTDSPITAALQLLEDLAERRSQITADPVRVELPGEDCPAPEALPADLARWLRGASFLGLDWDRPPTAGALDRASACGVEQRWHDIDRVTHFTGHTTCKIGSNCGGPRHDQRRTRAALVVVLLE